MPTLHGHFEADEQHRLRLRQREGRLPRLHQQALPAQDRRPGIQDCLLPGSTGRRSERIAVIPRGGRGSPARPKTGGFLMKRRREAEGIGRGGAFPEERRRASRSPAPNRIGPGSAATSPSEGQRQGKRRSRKQSKTKSWKWKQESTEVQPYRRPVGSGLGIEEGESFRYAFRDVLP